MKFLFNFIKSNLSCWVGCAILSALCLSLTVQEARGVVREQEIIKSLQSSNPVTAHFVKLFLPGGIFSDIALKKMVVDLALVKRLKLQNDPLEVQKAVAEVLAKRLPSSVQVHTELAGLLRHESKTTRNLAVSILGAIKPENISVLKKITLGLTNKNSDIRLSARQALIQIKPQDIKILMHLVSLFRNQDTEIQWAAAEAFHGIHPSNFKVFSAVAEEIVSPLNSHSQSAAIHALKGMVFKNLKFLPYTLKMIKHENPYIQKTMIEVLANSAGLPSFLEYETVRASLIIAEKLNHSNTNVRAAAAKALSQLSPANLGVEKALRLAVEQETIPDIKRTMFIALESVVLRRFLVQHLEARVVHTIGAETNNFNLKTDPKKGVVVEYATTHDFSEAGLKSKLKCLDLFNSPLPAT